MSIEQSIVHTGHFRAEHILLHTNLESLVVYLFSPNHHIWLYWCLLFAYLWKEFSESLLTSS